MNDETLRSTIEIVVMQNVDMEELEEELLSSLMGDDDASPSPSPSPSSTSTANSPLCFPTTPPSKVASPSSAFGEVALDSNSSQSLHQPSQSAINANSPSRQESTSPILPALCLPCGSKSTPSTLRFPYSSSLQPLKNYASPSKKIASPSVSSQSNVTSKVNNTLYQVLLDFILFDENGEQVSEVLVEATPEMTGSELILSFLEQIVRRFKLERDMPLTDWLEEARFFHLYDLSESCGSWDLSSVISAGETLGERKLKDRTLGLRYVDKVSREGFRAASPSSSLASARQSHSRLAATPTCATTAENISILGASVFSHISNGDKGGAIAALAELKREQRQLENHFSDWCGKLA